MSNKSAKIIFVVPALLIGAHISIFYAILSFGTRVDGYVINEIGRYIYATFIIFSTILLLATLRTQSPSNTQLLLTFTLPAFTGLVLQMMHAYLSGKYIAGYQIDGFDLAITNFLIIILIGILGIYYRNFIYTSLCFALLLGLQVFAISISHRLPPLPSTITFGFIIIVITGAMSTIPSKAKRSFWPTASLSNILGTMATLPIIGSFPKNGRAWEIMGSEVVPNNAWGWSLPFSVGLFYIAMIMPFTIALLLYIRYLLQNPRHLRLTSFQIPRAIFAIIFLNLITHITIVMAFFWLQANVDGNPIHPITFLLYALCLLFTGLFLVRHFRNQSNNKTITLIVLYTPMILWFLLSSSLTAKPRYASTLFAPNDPISLYFLVHLTFLVCTIFISYGLKDKTFLIFCFIVQFSIYMATNLANIAYDNTLLYFPLALFISSPMQLFVFLLILSTYIVVSSLINIDKENELIHNVVNWRFMAVGASLMGGFLSLITWRSLPQNGWELIWSSVTVPANAWGWGYSFVEGLLFFSLIASLSIIFLTESQASKSKI